MSQAHNVSAPPPPPHPPAPPHPALRTMVSRSSLFTVLVFSTSRPCWMTSASSRSFLYAFSITCGEEGGGGRVGAGGRGRRGPSL